MADLLHRSHAADLELRSDGRTIYGLAVPFDVEARVTEDNRTYREIFRKGAFRKTIAERGPARVKLLVQHNQQTLPIGRGTSLREDTRGLVGEFRVSNTRQGDEVIELIRDGVLDGFSIGFRSLRDRWDSSRTLVERLEVILPEVSVVTFPAYSAAQIQGVRTDVDQLPIGLARRRLDLYRKRIAP